MSAAFGTVEPSTEEFEVTRLLECDKFPFEDRRPLIEERIRIRLGELFARLGGAGWLDGDLSADDLLMVHPLLRLDGSGPLEEHPSLVAYTARGQARPGY